MNLADVFDRATDQVVAPQLAGAALDAARRRRSRSRVVVAAAAAAVVVVGTSALVGLQRRDDSSLPVQKPTPSPTVTPDGPVQDPTPGLTPTQPRWDPRKVDQLPLAPAGTVPGLPAVVDPPDTSLPLTAAPIDAAILAVEKASTVKLLSTTGEWRHVPLPGNYPQFELSPLGTRLLVVADDPDEAATVYDLATGASRQVSPTDGYQPVEYPRWAWIDDDTLLLGDADGGWRIRVEDGTGVRVPYPTQTHGWWTTDDAGGVVESADWGSPNVLTDWADGQPREVSMAATGRLSSVQANTDTVVGTSYDGHPFAVIVADRASLTPHKVLPIQDHDANYSNGGLSVLAVRDDPTVLLRVAVLGRQFGIRVVAWRPGSRELSLVSTVNSGVDEAVDFAEGLLRRTDP